MRRRLRASEARSELRPSTLLVSDKRRCLHQASPVAMTANRRTMSQLIRPRQAAAASPTDCRPSASPGPQLAMSGHVSSRLLLGPARHTTSSHSIVATRVGRRCALYEPIIAPAVNSMSQRLIRAGAYLQHTLSRSQGPTRYGAHAHADSHSNRTPHGEGEGGAPKHPCPHLLTKTFLLGHSTWACCVATHAAVFRATKATAACRPLHND